MTIKKGMNDVVVTSLKILMKVQGDLLKNNDKEIYYINSLCKRP